MNQYLNDLSEIKNKHLITFFKENENFKEIIDFIDKELKGYNAKTLDSYGNKDLKRIKKAIKEKLIYNKNNYIDIYPIESISEGFLFKIKLNCKDKVNSTSFELMFIIDNINKKIKDSKILITNHNLKGNFFDTELEIENYNSSIVLNKDKYNFIYQLKMYQSSNKAYVFIEKENLTRNSNKTKIDHSFYFESLWNYILKGAEIEKIKESIDLCNLTQDGNDSMIEDIIIDMKDNGFIFDKVNNILSTFTPRKEVVRKNKLLDFFGKR